MEILKSMLSLVDKSHSIYVDKQIGLIGNNNYKVSVTQDDIYVAGQEKQYKLGEYFEVICDKGYRLFDENVVSTGVIEDSSERKSYVFELKDYTVEDELNDFFGFSKEKLAAIVICKGAQGDWVIYTNCLELKDKYKYDKTIEYTKSICEIFNVAYRKLVIDNSNKIYRLVKKEEN